MTRFDEPSLDFLPPDVGQRIDAACERFEDGWLSGGRPPLDDFLTEPDGPGRAALLRELVLLDVRYRRKAGEFPSPADYAAHFPDGPPPWLVRAAIDRAGRFSFVGEVGHGGMGMIFRADDSGLGRELAVKVLHEKDRDNAAARSRFLREALFTARLQHPNIPAVHEQGELADGRPYFAMKLIGGRDLHRLLAERAAGAHDVSRWLPVFAQVCQGMAYAHSRGVLHRDLKPHNIMVGEFGEVQILDWGLAKDLSERSPTSGASAGPADTVAGDPEETADLMADASTDGRTQPGQAFGTPAYMPPEQARGEVDRIDHRSDVFALGGLLCTILTGSPPFAGSRGVGALAKARAADLTDAFACLDGCGADAELVALCKRCLAADPADRPTDAEAVAELVTAHQAAVAERLRQAELDGERQRVTAAEARKRRRVKLALVGVSLGLVAAAVLGLLVIDLWRDAVTARNGEKKARNDAEAARDAERVAREKLESFENQANSQRNRLGMQQLASPLSELSGFRKEFVRHGRISTDLLYDTVTSFASNPTGFVAAVLSPDGTHVVSVNADGPVRVWAAGTGQELFTLDPQAGPMLGVAFDKGGSRIATAGWDGTARVWDAKTGKELAALKGHERAVTAVAFSPDGTRVVTAGLDKSARIWDASSGKELRTLTGHTAALTAAAFSPDGMRVATGGRDDVARVWDAKTGEVRLVLTGHTAQVTAVGFSPTGDRIATASADQSARVWDAKTGSELTTKWCSAIALSVAFNSDGTRIASAGYERSVRVWNATTGKDVLTLNAHTSAVASVSFSPDGSRLVTASEDRTVRLWDATSGAVLRALKVTRPDGGPSPVVPAVASGTDGGVRVWDLKTGKETSRLTGHTAAVSWAAFNPDGTRIVTASGDVVRVWKAATGELVATLKGHAKKVVTAEFSPDGRYVVTASGDQAARVWDAATGKELLSLAAHARPVTTAAFSPDGKRVVTGSQDKNVRVWDVSGLGTATVGDKKPLALAGLADEPKVVWFDPTGTRVFAVGKGGSVWAWDEHGAGKQLYADKGFGPVTAAGVSPDRTRVVVAKFDRALRVIDTTTGTAQLVTARLDGIVDAVALTADGSKVVTGDWDGAVRVWDTNLGGAPRDAAVGKEVVPRQEPKSRITAVAFSPDGSRLVTAGDVWTPGGSKKGIPLIPNGLTPLLPKDRLPAPGG